MNTWAEKLEKNNVNKLLVQAFRQLERSCEYMEGSEIAQRADKLISEVSEADKNRYGSKTWAEATARVLEPVDGGLFSEALENALRTGEFSPGVQQRLGKIEAQIDYLWSLTYREDSYYSNAIGEQQEHWSTSTIGMDASYWDVCNKIHHTCRYLKNNFEFKGGTISVKQGSSLEASAAGIATSL